MDKLIAEFEIFCHVVETKPHVLYIPMLWLIFCCGMAWMIGGLGVDSSNAFYELVQQRLQKQHLKVLLMGFGGYFALTWMLYQKQRKRLF